MKNISLTPRLFMVLLGCKPAGRHVEQHDFFFGIAYSLHELIPEIKNFWPDSGDRIHIDGWREINHVEGYEIQVVDRNSEHNFFLEQKNKLFFLNLGGYQANKFEEQHYTLLTVKETSALALNEAKKTLFFQKNQFLDAKSHVDDKYGIDVDELYQIEDLLTPIQKETYHIRITPNTEVKQDPIALGYLKLSLLK